MRHELIAVAGPYLGQTCHPGKLPSDPDQIVVLRLIHHISPMGTR